MHKRQNRWWVTVILSVLIIAAVILLLLFRPNCAEIVNEYTITFISHNAEEEAIVHKTIKVKHGENIPFDEITPPEDYWEESEGVFYTFYGWYAEGDSPENLVDGQATATEDKKYIAYFEIRPDGAEPGTYIVRFYDSTTNKLLIPVQGEAVQYVKKGESAVAPVAPEHDGYEKPVWSHSFENVTSNLRVVARYMPKQYEVKKHILGEIESDKEYFNVEMKPSSPGDRGMLKFVDWYWNEDFKGEPVSEYELMQAQNVDVYAKYRIDFKGVGIVPGEGDLSYGGTEETLVLDGIIDDGRLEYSCEWRSVAPDKTVSEMTESGEDSVKFVLANSLRRDIAGEYDVEVLLKAKYKSPDLSTVLVSDETIVTQKITIGKREIFAEISNTESNFTYGQNPVVSINFYGFQYDDTSDLFNDKYNFTFNNESGSLKERLPVGDYTVSAEIEETDNYFVSIANDNSVTVKIDRKDLNVLLEAEDFTYGDGYVESHFDVNYDSFVYGEESNPEYILGTPIYEFTLNNESYNASAHTYVDAGAYRVRISGFTKEAENYAVNWRNALTGFEVSKRNVPVSLEVKDEITYGENPEYSINDDQILPEDRELFEFSFSLKYTSADKSSNGITYTPTDGFFPAGTYVVTASYRTTSQNYNDLIISDNNASFTVARKQLTVSERVENNYTYGTSVTVTPSFEGFVTGEDSGVLTVGQHLYTFKKEGEDYSYHNFSVGRYTVEYKSGYSSNNYDIKAAAPTEFSVNPKDMRVTLVKNENLNSHNTYGDFTAQNGPYKSVKFAEEDFAFNETADDIFKNCDKTIKYYKEKAEYTVNGYFDAGEYTVAIAGLVNNNVYGNYKIIIELPTFTIYRKTLTVNAPEAILETYDGKNYGRNLTDSDINGALSNTDYSISYTYDYLPADNFESLKKKDESLTDVSFSQAGVYTVKFTVGETNGKNNYDIVYRDGAQSYTVTILRAKGAITGADDLAAQSFDYTGKEHTVNVSGISKEGAGAGELTWSAAIDGAEKQIGNAGEYKFTDVKDGNGLKITITLNETVNCEGDVKYITVTVNKAEYTVTQSGALYTYNGTEQGHGVTVNGVLGTTLENVSVTYSNDLKTNGYMFKNAGKYNVEYTVSGNDNYNDKTGSYEIEIKKRDITLAPQVNPSYVFGEFTSETATITQTGGSFAPGENLKSAFSGIKCTFTKGGAAYTPEISYFDIGSYLVAIEGADNDNYNVTLNSVNFNVEKYKFTVGGNDINIRRKAVANGNSVWTYSGGSFFEFSGVVKLKNHDKNSYSADSENAFNSYFEWESDYKFTVNGVDVTENFEIEYALTVNLTDSIVSVTKPDGVHTYDGTFKQYGITVDVDDEVTSSEYTIEYQIDGKDGWKTDIPSFKDVKEGGYKVTYKITSEFFDTVTDDYTVTVTPKALNVNITSLEGDTYNGQEFVRYTSQTENVKVDGLISPDKDVYSVSVAEESRKTIKDAGEYTLIYTVKSNNINYSIAEFNAKLQIKIAPFDLGNITVGESTFTYNGAPHTVTVTPEHTAPEGENPIVLSGNFTVTNVADSNKAFYSVTDKNYVQVESTPVQITVNPATLTVSVSSPENKTYNNQEFSFSENTENVKVSGFVDGESDYTVTVTEKDGKTIKDAGTYTLIYEVTTDNGNYKVGEYTKECSVTIEKANYIITAEDKEYKYNGSEQGDGITVLGVNGEVVSPEITYGSDSAVPQFRDVQDGGYSVSYIVGMTENYNQATGSYKVTITPAELTAEITDQKEGRAYDGTELVISDTEVTVSGIMGEDKNVYTVSHEISCIGYEDKEILNAGEYTVTFTVSVSDKNYSISKATLEPYEIIIAKATLTYQEVTFDEGRTYDGEEHGPDKIILKTAADADAKLTVELNALDYAQTTDKVKNAGTWQYSFDISRYKNRNFEFGEAINTTFQESFTISPKEVTVECRLPDGESRGYSPGEVTTFSTDDITVKGFLPADGEPVTKVVKVNESAENLTAENAGDYQVFYQVTLTNDNYTIKNEENAKIKQQGYSFPFKINKATLTELPDGVSLPVITEQVNKLGKTLKDVSLTDGFSWANEETKLQLNSYGYKAYYNSDPANYNNYDVTITFTTRKEKVTITPTNTNLEFDFGKANENAVYANYDIKGEGSRSLSTEELALITKTIKGISNYDIGSTYLADIAFTASNNYFELTDTTSFANVVVKIKSVDVGGTLYTIEDALAKATSGTITVTGNTSFATQKVAAEARYTSPDYYTIKAGVTLFLPYDISKDEDRGVGTGGAKNDNPGLDGTTHKDADNEDTYKHSSRGDTSLCDLVVTVPDGMNLINSGTLNIGGITTGGNGGSARAGQTASGYAKLVLGAGSTLTSTGTMNVYGFIEESSANNNSQILLNGGSLTMPFVVVEHRGGAAFLAMIGGLSGALGSDPAKNLQTSPFNRFYMENVHPKLTVSYGSKLIGSANLYASDSDNQTSLTIIGNDSNSLIQLKSDAKAVAKFNNATAVTDLQIKGSMNLNALSLKINSGLGNVNMHTKAVFFPISWYYNITLSPFENGGNATVNTTAQKFKIMPGASLTIEKGVSLNASDIVVYGEDAIKDIVDTEGEYEKKNEPSVLIVNGTLTATNLAGFVQTKQDGATITITGSTTITTTEVKAHSGSGLNGKVDYKNNIVSTLTGDVYNYSGNVSQMLSSGTYISKNSAWITDDSKFEIKYVFKYQNSEGVSIESVEGASANNPATYTIVDNYELQPASHMGYEFIGWYSNEDCTESIETFVGSSYNYQSVTLYGLFKQLPEGTVSYELTLDPNHNGENSVKNVILILSTKLEEFNLSEKTPTREGYKFLGWYKESDGTTKVDTLSADSFKDNKLTLYAKWEVLKFKLTLNIGTGTTLTVTANGVNVSSGTEVEYGATIVVTAKLQDKYKDLVVSSTPAGLAITDGSTFTMPAEPVIIKTSATKDSGGFCLTPDSLITLADGTQKQIKDLQMGVDEILTFDHFTGQWTSSSNYLLIYRAAANLKTVKLYFSDDTMVHVVVAHGFFDLNTNQYEIISTENVADYVGHKFYNIVYGDNGFVNKAVELVRYEIVEEYGECYSLFTSLTVNHVVNGMLAVTDDGEGLYNFFELDSNMKYDEEKMQADIEKYGLFTYEEFAEYITEEEFYMFNVQYLKVAYGKGLVTMERIYHYFDVLATYR